MLQRNLKTIVLPRDSLHILLQKFNEYPGTEKQWIYFSKNHSDFSKNFLNFSSDWTEKVVIIKLSNYSS